MALASALRIPFGRKPLTEIIDYETANAAYRVGRGAGSGCDCLDCAEKEKHGLRVGGITVMVESTSRLGLVNGHIVEARWRDPAFPAGGSVRAEGEVLRRALVLACLAYPERMRSFPCGTRL